MKESEDLGKFRFILWVDLGYDGWHPRGFNTEEELLAGIGETYGNDYIVTTLSSVRMAVGG
jgi:hypothetical protein